MDKSIPAVGALGLVASSLLLGYAIKSLQVKCSKNLKAKAPVRVVISGAAGLIAYSLIPEIASGAMFGPSQPVILHLLDIPPCEKKLRAVVMEIEDSCFPLVQGIVATTDVKEAFNGVQYALLTGGFPRGPGMERSELMAKNSPIFVAQGKALSDFADRNCKVLVVANPANTNCLVAQTNCPNIPKENFSALTRLDMNRAKAQLAKKLSVSSDLVRNVSIWGNHSPTMVPDASRAQVEEKGKQVAVSVDEDWVAKEFTPVVQQRGKTVIEFRNASSAASAAHAITDHMRDWVLGTPEGEHVSMAVVSDGSYDITPGIVYSFPVVCKNGQWKIVQGLKLDARLSALLKVTEKELLSERAELPQ